MIRLTFIAAASFATFAVPVHAQETQPDNATQSRRSVELPAPDQSAITHPENDTTSAAATNVGPDLAALPAMRVIGTRYHFRVSDTASDSSSATRTNTPLIEIPQSVQVLPRNLLQEQDARTLADALVNVSGVTPSQPEENLFVAPIVRGFPAEIYLDGLPMYGMSAANSPASMVGVERIEVLKGPNSTLYGGGLGSPLGGLINIVSEQPESEAGGYVAMRTGSYGTVNPYFDLTGPLTSTINARIAGEYQSNGSWIDKVRGDRWSVQPSVSFQLDPKTTLLVQGQFSHSSQLEYSGLPAAQALAGELDRDAFPGAPNGQPKTTIDNRMVTVNLQHEFNDSLRLSVSGRYFDSSIPEYGSFVYPGAYPADPATPTTYPILRLNMMTGTREGTFDANLLAKVNVLGGRHELMAGVNYDHTEFSSDMGFNGVPVGDLDLANPVYNLAYGSVTPFNLTQNDTYQTIAVYVQDQATYGRLHLTGSLRFTQLNFREAEQAINETYHRVSPRIGASFDLAPGVAVYAAYATAFRAAFGYVGLEPPKPETSRNIEAGVKLALKDVGLSGTIAAFEQTRNNVATPDPNDPLYSIQTGQQRARGVETDLMWEPTPAFSLLANYAYTNATVTQDNSIPVGDTLARVPKNSGRVAFRYRVLNGPAQGMSFGAGVTAFGSREDTLPNTVSVPGYAVVDAQVEYTFDRYTVALSGVNLTNRRAYDTYEYLSFPVVMPIQPRSVYLTLKARI
ncbi:TonB-dependent siderophore receptor [Paraburkholderia caribensis]|uniref:TonB-dependent siderophore receptor n=1 Tax=Paraburkholderia caribensis TaxID=75105 RepID=UPI00078E03D7|nr:TonB-dependent siderophore receptor [Paraburkholderia caribensis]AMV48238.1 ligand-gated channel [Paraburkholderia caribensis]